MFHQGKNIDIYVKKILSFNQLNFITETKKKVKVKEKLRHINPINHQRKKAK